MPQPQYPKNLWVVLQPLVKGESKLNPTYNQKYSSNTVDSFIFTNTNIYGLRKDLHGYLISWIYQRTHINKLIIDIRTKFSIYARRAFRLQKTHQWRSNPKKLKRPNMPLKSLYLAEPLNSFSPKICENWYPMNNNWIIVHHPVCLKYQEVKGYSQFSAKNYHAVPLSLSTANSDNQCWDDILGNVL